MNTEKIDNTKTLRLAFSFLAAIFSFIGAILVFTTEFSGWWLGGSYSNWYLWIGSENAPIWAQIFLVLLGLLFVLSLIYSVVLIIGNFGKLTIPLTYKLQAIIGIAISGIIFVFTALIVVIQYIIAAEAEDWWLETSFYSSLVGSILLAIFYILYLLLTSTSEKAAK